MGTGSKTAHSECSGSNNVQNNSNMAVEVRLLTLRRWQWVQDTTAHTKRAVALRLTAHNVRNSKRKSRKVKESGAC